MNVVSVLTVFSDIASSCSACSGQGQRPIGEPYLDNGYVVDLEVCEECADIYEARAAVAELIEAAQYAFELAEAVDGMSRNNIENIAWEVAQRLGPALANVRGQ